MENGMEWKETFGMEDAQNGMEWKIVFHSSILTTYKFTEGLYIKTYNEVTKYTGRLYLQTRMRIISHFSVLQCEFLACSD